MFLLNRNLVRFTPTQIEAIKSGMQPGLTLVVGPPGKYYFFKRNYLHSQIHAE